jgi:hypothetical protein
VISGSRPTPFGLNIYANVVNGAAPAQPALRTWAGAWSNWFLFS